MWWGVMKDDDSWREVFRMAMLELDSTKLQARIICAKQAISRRVKELGSDHGGTPEECQAISDALNSLRVLQREFDNASGWPK
jgi:hypothetical protein